MLRKSLLCTCLALSLASVSGCSETSEEFEVGCAVPVVTGQTFSLPQTEGDRSFQTHATFDGEAIWLTHAGVLVDQEELFVSALRIQCDGTVSVPSVRVPVQSGLQTEPRVASHKGNVLLAWQRDSQQGGTNLSISYLFFDRQDGPANASLQALDTQYNDASAGNTWMPEIDASDSGFVIAGLRGVSDQVSFQSFAQRLDTDGMMIGDAINGELQDESPQDFASATLGDDGSVILGWTRTDIEQEHVVHVLVEPDASVPSSAPIRVTGGLGTMANVGGDQAQGQFIAWSSAQGDVSIKPAALFNPNAPVLTLREAGGNTPIYPRIAVGPDGGAVAWLEIISGFDTEIHIQGFSGDGFEMQKVGSEKTIVTDAPAIGAYRISITHIQDSIYFLTWTEGPTSDLQVKWRLVNLAS